MNNLKNIPSPLMISKVYEAVNILKNGIKKEEKYNLSIISAFHLLNKALKDENVLSFILDDDLKVRHNFIRKLKYKLIEHVGTISEYCSSTNLSEILEARLISLVTDLFAIIRDLISAEGADFIDEDYDDSTGEENGVVCDIEDVREHDMDIDMRDRIDDVNGIENSVDIEVESWGREVENGVNEVENGGKEEKNKENVVEKGVNEVVSEVEKRQEAEVDSIIAKGGDAGLTKGTDLDDTFVVNDAKNTIASAYDSTSDSTGQSLADGLVNSMVEVTHQYQQHAVTAIERADMMHQLFIDATQKIEFLMRESDALRDQLLNLTLRKGAEGIEGEGNFPRIRMKSDDSNDEALKIENLERLLELDEFSDPENDGSNENTEYDGLNGSIERRKKKHKFTLADYDMVPHTEVFGADRMSSVIDGVIEALRIVGSKGTKYESLDTKNIRRSILQHGWSDKGVWNKCQLIEGVFHIGASTITFNKIQELGDVINRIFNHLKECEITGAVGLIKKSVIKISLVRNALKDMNFKMRDVDILCSSLGVPHLSLIGLSYVLTACTVKRFQKDNFEIILDKLINILKLYWLHAKIMIRLREEKSTPVVEPIKLTSGGMTRLMVSLDREKSIISSIFKAYIETPKYFPSGSSSKSSSFKSNPSMLSGPGGPEGYSQGSTNIASSNQVLGKVGDYEYGNASSSSGSRNKKLFPTQRIENDIDKQKVSAIGISYRGIVQFAQDFDLYPSVLSTSQLFTIFNEMFTFDKEHSGGEEEAKRSETELIKPHYYLNIGNNNDALLTLDQFQRLLVAVAFTSLSFQGEVDASSSIYFKDENSEDFLYLQALKKVNRLLIYLNESRGQERLSKKHRSVTSSVLIFKPIS
jgi:hypothetical protein